MEKVIRYTLLVAAMFACNLVAFGNHGGPHYLSVHVEAYPTVAGSVYVSDSGDATTESGTETSAYDCSTNNNTDSKTYHFLAVTADEDQYVFDGWYDGSTRKSEIGELKYQETISTSSTNKSYSVTRTAKWVQPVVTAAHNLALTTVTNPEDRPSGSVTFDLNDDISILHFDRTEGVENDRGFELGTNTYATGTFTVPVTYTPQRKHGSYSGTITLNSQYKDDPKMATVTVTEDYTPSFSVPVPSYNFTPDDALFTGSTKESIKFVPAKPNYAASSPYTQWTATISGTNASIFRILGEPDADGGVVVSFEPTEAGDNFSASLDFSCIYTDANGLEISSGTHSISLSGDAQVSTRSCITLGGSESYAHTFASANVGSTTEEDVTMVVENVANIRYEWESGNGNNMFSCEIGGGFITLTVNGSGVSTGQYSAVLRLYGDNTLAGGTTEKLLTVNATMCLGKPELQALAGYECATLIWPVVEGATGYEVYQNNADITSSLTITTTDGNKTCQITGLTNGTQYVYRVVAVASEATYNGVDTKTCTPGTIVAEAAKYLGIKTGTNGSTDIDLTYAFVEGKAYFDLLYLFGATIGSDVSSNKVVSTAVIPCYIFEKHGDDYIFSKKIENMNIPSKTSDFKIDVDDYEHLKVYVSGYCHQATTGYSNSDDGVFLFSGSSGKTMDLYLENTDIYARHRTQDGKAVETCNSSKKNEYVYVGSTYSGNVPKGTGSVYSFKCKDNNSTGFLPTIHIRGNNTARSTDGSAYGDNWQWCAPVDIHISSSTSCTKLTLDDLWPVSEDEMVHTNGSLNLFVYRDQSLAINVGNEKGVVTFNGGNYVLHSGVQASTSSSQYKVFMAIGMQKLGSAYGVGNTAKGGTVIFNDGTFNTDKAPGTAPYSNKWQIRTPGNTTINGGSFLCDVVACAQDPNTQTTSSKLVDRYDEEIVRTKVKVDAVSSNNLAHATLPYDADLYYYEHGSEYGQESVRPTAKDANGDQWVYFYLPGKGDYGFVDYPWLYVVPPMTGSLSFGDAEVGGDETAHTEEKSRTHYLLYVEVDSYTRAQINAYKPSEQTVSLKIKPNAPDHGDIINTEDYKIDKSINMLIPIVADRWYTFTAPFDVNKVSILETVDEATLATYSLDDAYAEQAYNFVDWVAYLAKNIYSGSKWGFSTSSTFRTYSQMFDLYKKNINTEASQTALKAYTGPTDWSANYYLFEPAIDGVASNHWTAGSDNLAVEWIPAQPFTDDNEKTAVMRRGKTYAIQFPYCPGCDAAHLAQDPGYVRNYWDYWTGKYILLEGYGPQTIWGKTSLSTNELTPFNESNQAAFRGNASFAETTVTNDNVWFHNDATDMFVKTSNYVAKPGQGFLLVNRAGGSAAPVRSYPFSAPNTGSTIDTTTGLPTIGQSEYRALNPTGAQVTKVLIDGQLYILRDNRLYDLHGREIMSE